MKKFATPPSPDLLDQEIERLYQRKLVIEDAIASLERYEESIAAVRPVRLDNAGLALANAGSLAS